MASQKLFLAAALGLLFCIEIVSSASPRSIRNERDVGSDIKKGLKDLENEVEKEVADLKNQFEKIGNEFQELIDSIWGGTCLNDNACYEEISYCQREAKSLLSVIVGKCFPREWVFLTMIFVALVIIALNIACCACIRKCFC